MLGDEEDKRNGNPLNPLKKAMKRRNAKTVQFAAPSYVEPSDVEYSSDEDEGNGEYGAQEQDSTATQNSNQSNQVDEGVVREPLKNRDQARDVRQNGDSLVSQSLRSGGVDQGNAPDPARTSDEVDGGEYSQLVSHPYPWLIVADNAPAAASRIRTVRNTDSFFKDDGVETRKINLTPSLLRDDSNGSVLKSSETKDVSQSSSQYEDVTDVTSISSRTKQVSTLSKENLLPKKGRKTKSGRKKEACLEACSKEKIKRVKVMIRKLKAARNHPTSWQGRHCHPRQGCRHSQKNRWNHSPRTHKLPKLLRHN